MIVRRINKNDLEKVKNIYALAFDTEVLVQIDYINQDIYVVCKDDLILGMCMVNYIDDIFVGKRTAYINAVCVDKQYRKHGVATFMLGEIEKMCIEDGCTEIMLTSSSKRTNANKLYKELGYNIYDTNVFKKEL